MTENTNVINRAGLALWLAPLLFACGVDTGDTAPGPHTAASRDPGAALVAPEAADPSSPEAAAPLRQAMAEIVAARTWGEDAEVHGVYVLPTGDAVYLAGSTGDAEALLLGERAEAPVGGVIVALDGACVGVVDALDAEDLADPYDLAGPCPADLPAPAELHDEAANLSAEAEAYAEDVVDAPTPPAVCGVACGADDGFTYGGQEAKSNGAQTGTGSSCGAVNTYGYQYQCVEYTERYSQRSDWAGNAYAGYWSQSGLSSGSTSQGPYYKGLLPLGSGTSYVAPAAGDIVVWSGGAYGHVGVLASVSGGTATVYDQNRRCGDQSCTLTYTSGGTYQLANGSAAGSCGAESLSAYTLAGWLRRGWDFGGYYGLATSAANGASTHNWWLNDATYSGGTTSGTTTDISDYITIDPGASDPYMTSPSGLKIPAYNAASATHGYKYFNVYLQSNCTNKSAQLFWNRSGEAFAEGRSVRATISGSGWQTLTFDVSADADWSGTIEQIRLDPANSCTTGSGDTVSIAYAWFSR